MENSQQISEALSLTEQILDYVEDAESSLSSARGWGFFDVFGGGFITDMIKHSKINHAGEAMDHVNSMMRRLQDILGSIQVSQDYRIQIGNFATFADFFFDGCLADIYMLSRIMESLDEVRDLKHKLYTLRSMLEDMQH